MMTTPNVTPGYFRIWHIVGNPKANPPIPAIIPVSRSTWLAWVKSGKAPAPRKLSERTTAWVISEIYAFAEQLNTTQYMPTKNISKKVAQ
jgi:predicted DNA-binding transcriptional regulator AlpA